MTFLPVLPASLLALFIGIIVVVRVANLYRLLTRTAPGRYRYVVLRWSGLTFAALLLALAAFRPGLLGDGDQRPATAESAEYVSDINLFLVVDRSVTSRIPDYGDGEARMAGIRDDIAALLKEYRGARVGLIGFATEASVNWPLSQDEWSFQAYLKNLSAYALTPYDAFSFIDPTAAAGVLSQQLEVAKVNYPRAKNLVFYFGDGAVGTEVEPRPFEVPTDLFAGGAVLGYGTVAGGPIPHSFANGRKNYLGDPATGVIVRSGLDEPRLRGIAEAMDVPYFHREARQSITPVLPAVNSSFMSDTIEPTGDDPLIGRTELYWMFALIATALLLVEAILTVREYRRNRMSRTDFSARDALR
ncbi:vWA domain-containing protein [Mycolicibacterium litorale]|uniref:vWA domain-containing protein n=1 Tax=Mycolicibacterium litorale TaxID=758802 RepID=UPI003CF1F5DF